MGLDMYVYKNVEKDKEQDNEPFMYWRKFNALQGWFEENYDIENCGNVDLTPEVLDNLLEDIKDKNLHPTEGFFYGSPEEVTDEEYKELEELFTKILNDKEDTYYYTCWY